MLLGGRRRQRKGGFSVLMQASSWSRIVSPHQNEQLRSQLSSLLNEMCPLDSEGDGGVVTAEELGTGLNESLSRESGHGN